jgi:hypothetical protein
MTTITRKVFLRELAGGAFVALLGGCGGGGDAETANPQGGSCQAFTLSANHGHELSIPEADLASTTDKVYSIVGTATHDHPLTITAAQLALLKAGKSITLTTPPGLDGHTHDVSGACS